MRNFLVRFFAKLFRFDENWIVVPDYVDHWSLGGFTKCFCETASVNVPMILWNALQLLLASSTFYVLLCRWSKFWRFRLRFRTGPFTQKETTSSPNDLYGRTIGDFGTVLWKDAVPWRLHARGTGSKVSVLESWYILTCRTSMFWKEAAKNASAGVSMHWHPFLTPAPP